MKRYYPLAGRWVQLDSYRRQHPHRIHPTVLNIASFMFLVFIWALITGAFLGADITAPHQEVHHEHRD